MQNNSSSNKEKQTELPRPSQKIQNLHGYKIVLIIEIFLMAVLIIANIAVMFLYTKPNNSTPNNSTSNDPVQTSDTSTCKHRTKEELLDLTANVTKDEAIDVLKSLYGESKCTFERFLPEKLKRKPDESTPRIIYSYDDAAEVPNIAQDSVVGLKTNSADDFLIDETTEYYTIVSVDESKVSCGKSDDPILSTRCYRGISFDKKYLNYYKEAEGPEEKIFNDLSPDFVELALKVLIATDIWSNGSLYDYYFENNDDSFTLTGIYFGVGLDMDKLEGGAYYDLLYAINIYEKKLNLDKNTRKVNWEKYDSRYYGESFSKTLRSLSLSNSDIAKIQAIINDLNSTRQSD